MELFFDENKLLVTLSQLVDSTKNRKSLLLSEIEELKTRLSSIRNDLDQAHRNVVAEERESVRGRASQPTLILYHDLRKEHGSLYKNVKLAEKVLLRMSY